MTRTESRYDGDTDTGITLYIRAKDSAKNITVSNSDSNERLIVNTDAIETITGAPFGAGDMIEISTVKGSKSVRLLREAQYHNIFNAIDKTSDWITLLKGQNTIDLIAEEGVNYLELTIEYRSRFAGV